jgi:hypothetical protein
MREQERTCHAGCVLLEAEIGQGCVRGGICFACRVCMYFYCRSRDWVGVCEGGGMDFACWKGGRSS